MSELVVGTLDVQNNASQVTITLNADTSQLVVKNAAGQEIIRLDGSTGNIISGGNGSPGELLLKSDTGGDRIRLEAKSGDISAGGNGKDGDLLLFASGGDNSTSSKATIRLSGEEGHATLGGNGTNGRILLRGLDNTKNVDRIRLEGGGGNIWLGGNDEDGDLVLFGKKGDNSTLAKATIHLSGGDGHAALGGNGTNGDMVFRGINDKGKDVDRIRLEGGGGNIWLGGHDVDGDLVLFGKKGDNSTLTEATIHLSGGEGHALLGGSGTDGDIVLRSTRVIDKKATDVDRIRLEAGGGNIWLGGNGQDGDLVLFASGGDNVTLDQATIHLDGERGDIILRNADCAEEFDVLEDQTIEPGTVLVIDDGGGLRASRQAYDRRAAGVVSGAGSYRPGIVLDRNPSAMPRKAVALMGKVFCKVDADYGGVEPGDLLTTSSTPGCAMKAADPSRAFGAVIGKALAPLSSGRGLIPILVAMQ